MAMRSFYALYDGVTADMINEERAALLGSDSDEEDSASAIVDEMPPLAWAAIAVVTVASVTVAFRDCEALKVTIFRTGRTWFSLT